METLNQLGRKIGHTEDLQSVVTIMKSVAAVSIRQYEQAAESLQMFMKTVEAGLSIVMQDAEGGVPAVDSGPGSHVGVVIFGSRQGMCGQFNEVIAEYTERTLKSLPGGGDPRRIHAVVTGNRVQPLLNHPTVSGRLPLPGSAEAIPGAVQTVLKTIETWRRREPVDRVLLFYNHKSAGSSFHPRHVRLLPLDRDWLDVLKAEMPSYRSRPVYTLDRNRLFSALIRQWFFYAVYQAFAESLASENAARLASMQAAERNIQDYLDGLRRRFNQKRQDAITGELLDIIGGYEALR